MRLIRTVGVCALASILVAGRPPLVAQTARTIDPAFLNGFRWRSIGPANTGGRIDDIAVARVPGLPDAIYVATASGGLFKSNNQGTTWTPVFDRVDAMMSIGDVAVARSDAAIVWVGTGEPNNRQSSSWGDGVYRSADAGRTWTSVGLRDTKHVGRIVVHPANPSIVYVAAAGHLWGPNEERGVFKTADGGQTWEKVLFVDANTGATDLAMDPRDPETVYAAMYQRQRAAWGFNGGGTGSGIFRTRDGGATWTRLSGGLPKGEVGRIGLATSPVDTGVVYAIVEAGGQDGGVYRSTDGGNAWERLSSLNPRPMYFSQIRLDPKDRSRVYLLGSNRGFYVSDDSGRTFRDMFSAVHAEDHALWIDPDDTNHLIVGGDGGVSISWDRGTTWQFRDNLPIGQFYEIAADMQDPYTICGGLQDNGHWCVPSATRNRTGISNRDGFNIGSGDGFSTHIDPTDPRIVIVESQEGRALRVNLATLERQVIAPLSERGTRRDRERWNWNTPIVMSAFDPKVLYIGSSIVYRSTDLGATWKAISPDLTARIDRGALHMMGAPVPERALSRHDGQTSFSTISTIAESPLDARLLYTGSDDGQVFVTRDGGQKWSNVTANIPGLPPSTYVSSVLPSRHVVGRVYATFDGHFNDDYHAYVYVSDDFGHAWRPIAAGLPQTSVNRLREHPRTARLLFVGHERGIHVSLDAGAAWLPLNLNMPNVPVDDLLIHPRDNDLVVGTHGRSIWILDNIAPLEALAGDATRTDAYLVAPSRARLLSLYTPQAWFGAGQFFAPNPEFGATIDFFLPEASPEDTVLRITDANHQPIRTLKIPSRRGHTRTAWDLRFEPTVVDSSTTPGPLVLPGSYGIALNAPGANRELNATLVVERDPRAGFSDADRRTRQTALMDLYSLQQTLATARTATRDVRPAPTNIHGAIAAQINVIGNLARAIEGYSGVPTADQHRQIGWAFDEVGRIVTEVNRLLRSATAAPSQPIAVPPKRS